MDIKCKECGSVINLDESIRNNILSDEIKKHDDIVRANHQKEIERVKSESIRLLESKKLAFEEGFKNQVS